MASTALTTLTNSIQALRTAVKKAKLTAQLEDPLQQLDSIVKLLEISKPSEVVLDKLTSLLAQRLLPLYTTFPILGISYTVAVLIFVHQEKIIAVSKPSDSTAKERWETVITALLSGILDFLERHPSGENRAVVATAFYPVLGIVFFPPTTAFHLPFQPKLLWVLYQLLGDTATSQFANQSKLRSQEIFGGARIGLILYHTKDFLAIEALLELFVKILPSRRDAASAKQRIEFIEEVFNPAIFTCASEIVAFFQSTTTTDWEDMFSQLIKILGNADITFPQIFDIDNFNIQGSHHYPIHRLYVDHRTFIGNIEKDGLVETFHAAFASVENIKVATVTKLQMAITVALSSSPFVGQAALTDGGTIMSFNLHAQDATRFLRSLKDRKVDNIIHQTGRKLSMAEAILELDFDLGSKEIPLSAQDKVRDMARIWNPHQSDPHSQQVLPSSPLVAPSIFIQVQGRPNSLNATLADGNDEDGSKTLPNRQKIGFSSSEYDSIFDEELTDVSDVELPIPKAARDEAKIPILINSDDDEPEVKVPVAKRTRGKTKAIVISEDEIEELKTATSSGPNLSFKRTASEIQVHVLVDTNAAPKVTRVLRSHAPRKEKLVQNGQSIPEVELLESCQGPAAIEPTPPTPTDTDQGKKDNSLEPQFRTARASISRNPEKSGSVLPTGQKDKRKPKLPDIPHSASIENPAKGVKTAGRKRKALADINPDAGGSGTEAPSPQKPRGKVKADAQAAPKRPPQKRYRRKGRTSSPALPDTAEVDFDKVPTRSDNPFHASKEEETRRNRIAGMKGKYGRGTAKPKPIPKKPKVKSEPDIAEASPIAAKEDGEWHPTVIKVIDERSPDIGILEIQPTPKEQESKQNAHLARPAPIPAIDFVQDADQNPQLQEVIEISSKTLLLEVSSLLPSNSAKTKKSRDAPWTEANFRTSIPTFSGIIEEPLKAQTGTLGKKKASLVNDTSPQPMLTMNEPKTFDEVANDFFPPSPKMKPNSPPPDHLSDDDVSMIDLTKDSPHLPPGSPIRSVSPIVIFPGHNTPQSRSFSPQRFSIPRTNQGGASFAFRTSYRPSRINLNTPSTNRQKHHSATEGFTHIDCKESRTKNQHRRKPGYEQENLDQGENNLIPEIVNVITDITQVIADKTSQRFENVRKDLRGAQASILREAGHDLEAMLSESVEHYQKLASLESGYTAQHRAILDGWKGICKATQDTSRFLATAIHEHNRNSLSRKLPNKFFSSPLPGILSNPVMNWE